MEFKAKLQQLRKASSLTQEELAVKLFVSRTAISKWETGKGYPNLESLQGISKIFNITINDLLSSEEILVISQEDKRNTSLFYTVFSFMTFDILTVLLMFLPMFSNRVTIPILMINIFKYETTAFLKVILYIFFSGSGILAITECIAFFKYKHKIHYFLLLSLLFGAVFLFYIINIREPYPTSILFIFLVLKAILFFKTAKTK